MLQNSKRNPREKVTTGVSNGITSGCMLPLELEHSLLQKYWVEVDTQSQLMLGQQGAFSTTCFPETGLSNQKRKVQTNF